MLKIDQFDLVYSFQRVNPEVRFTMPQCIVIADDLTGGNATGVLLRQLNYRALSVLNAAEINPADLKNLDCLICPTDSRAVEPEEAARRVRECVQKFAGAETKVFAKRIDSTMRGNIGAEIDAMLEVLGDDYIAILAPAFPSSGRVVCGGYMLVKGTLLHKTDIAIDPKTPVTQSEIAPLVAAQSRFKIHSFFIRDLMHGKHALAARMQEAVSAGARILSFDCITQEDLELIADACITARLKIAAVDPGVFTATYARKVIPPQSPRRRRRVLGVIGTVHPLAKVQLDELMLSQRLNSAVVQTAELLEGPERREAEIARVCAEILARHDKFAVSLVTGDGLMPEKRINFTTYLQRYNCSLDEVTTLINDAFGEITLRILQQAPDFRGIYSSGGDITVAVCRKVQTSGIDLQAEVLPLAAFGTFMDGPFKGVQIITKGGSQGGSDAVVQCINYLKKSLYI